MHFPSLRTFRFLMAGLSAAGLPVAAFGIEVDVAHEVVPILQKHCVECHGGEEAEGGFSLNTRALVLEAKVLDPDEPDDSIFMGLSALKALERVRN